MRKRLYTAVASLSILFPAAALADMAPDVNTIGSLSPFDESPLVMESEVVSFTVPKDFGDHNPYSEDAAGYVPGTATFVMKNPTDAAVNVMSVFPLYLSGQVKPTSQYARNVSVTQDGKPLFGHLKDDASYPYVTKDGSHRAVVAPGYVFPVSVPAHASSTFVVSFEAPEDGPGWEYLLDSGSGWGGRIGTATIKVTYPIPIGPRWVTIFSDVEQRKDGTYAGLNADFRVAGNVATLVLRDLEPTEKDNLGFTVLAPKLAERIITAQAAVKAWDKAHKDGEYPRPYRDLMDTYRAAGFVDDYWIATDTYFDRYVGTHDSPQRFADASEMADHFTNNWEPPCDGAGCDTGMWSSKDRADALRRYLSEVLGNNPDVGNAAQMQLLVDKLIVWEKELGYLPLDGGDASHDAMPTPDIKLSAPKTVASAFSTITSPVVFGLGALLGAGIMGAISLFRRRRDDRHD